MKHLFFVYGTLKQGYGNNRLLQTAKFLGNAITPAEYTLYNGGFPIVERGGETAIKGEVYETDDEQIIKRVYGLEGYSGKPHADDNWYDVDRIETPFGEAEMFVMDKGKSGRTNILTSGLWK